jgi:hypothetical protein
MRNDTLPVFWPLFLGFLVPQLLILLLIWLWH